MLGKLCPRALVGYPRTCLWWDFFSFNVIITISLFFINFKIVLFCTILLLLLFIIVCCCYGCCYYCCSCFCWYFCYCSGCSRYWCFSWFFLFLLLYILLFGLVAVLLDWNKLFVAVVALHDDGEVIMRPEKFCLIQQSWLW